MVQRLSPRNKIVLVALAGCLLATGFQAPPPASKCDCDPVRPETFGVLECSLCIEAEKQPPDSVIFFLKDISPRKPNRWLALPRKHLEGKHTLDRMSLHERQVLWTAAIERARSLWGSNWGLAYNGDQVRTQCHTHIHIGKWLPDSEDDQFVVTDTAATIPAPNGRGMRVHEVGGKLHVHAGEQIQEKFLMR